MPHLVGCHACGAVQCVVTPVGCDALSCHACRTDLERRTGCHAEAALAFSVATWLLLIPANLLPFLETSAFGVSRRSWLVSSVTAMAGDGYPDLAAVFGLFVVVLPLLRFGLLTIVLAALRAGHRPRWLGAAFRWESASQPWAMPDVFLLGLLVAYARLGASVTVEAHAGAWCFVAASLLSLLTRATLNRAAVWRAISPDSPADAHDADEADEARERRRAATPPDTLSCGACALLLPAAAEGGRCPRCQGRLHARKPDAIGRATALALAAALLYVPANLYPMATLPVGLASVKYTVIQGVVDLVGAGLWALALLVLVASFVVPLLKLGALAWLIASVRRRSARHLVAKTRLYRVVEEIGRWSMVDPYVIATFVPVTQFNELVHGSAQPAAPAFAAVVILTTLAARAFDPRLLWDAAAPSRRSGAEGVAR